MLLFCGRSVERVLGGSGIVILYLVGAYAAAAAQYAVAPGLDRADGRRERRDLGRARRLSPCCSAATR